MKKTNKKYFSAQFTAKTRKIIKELPWGKRRKALEKLIQNNVKQLQKYAA